MENTLCKNCPSYEHCKSLEELFKILEVIDILTTLIKQPSSKPDESLLERPATLVRRSII